MIAFLVVAEENGRWWRPQRWIRLGFAPASGPGHPGGLLTPDGAPLSPDRLGALRARQDAWIETDAPDQVRVWLGLDRVDGERAIHAL